MRKKNVTEEELHQHLDGELPPSRVRDGEAHLLADPDSASRVAAYRQQKSALHARFDGALGEIVPERLLAAAGPGNRRSLGLVLKLAAAVLLLAASWSAGWAMRGGEGVALAQQAALAHAVFTPEKRHPVEVDGGQEEHLVAWLSKRLGAPLRAPALNSQGYTLVGGRLLTGSEGPAAQFMYENEIGERLTLNVAAISPFATETEFHFVEQLGLAMFLWVDGPLGFALTARAEREALSTIAREVYEQLMI